MNIGIDASRANEKQKTGVEWYAYHIILELQKKYSDNNSYTLYFKSHPQEAFKSNNKFLKWPPQFLWTHIRLSFELFFNKPEILFIPAHVIPLYHPVKSVMTIHDVAFKEFKETYSLKERLYQEWSVKFALKNAYKIIVPTQFTKNEIKKYYPWVNTKKIKVVHNGFTKGDFTERYQKETIDLTMNQFDIKNPYFLMVGRIEEKKNIINQIKAFELFKDTYKTDHELILVGKPGYGYADIKEYINNSRYIDSIKELHWVEQCELPVLYQAADIFLYATKYEGFGVPVLEAFASQTPVITSKGGAHEEVGGDGAYYIDHKNIESITNAINDVFVNKDLRQSLIQKGYQRIDDFSWEKCTKEIYNELVSDN